MSWTKNNILFFSSRRIKFAQTLFDSEHQQTVFTIILEWRKQRLQLFSEKCGLDSAKERRSALGKLLVLLQSGARIKRTRRDFYKSLPWRQLKWSLVIQNLTDSLSTAEQLSQSDSWSSLSLLCSFVQIIIIEITKQNFCYSDKRNNICKKSISEKKKKLILWYDLFK